MASLAMHHGREKSRAFLNFCTLYFFNNLYCILSRPLYTASIINITVITTHKQFCIVVIAIVVNIGKSRDQTSIPDSSVHWTEMAKVEKEPLNFVHQNAILCETINKETRHQKLYTNYSVNPFRKSKYTVLMCLFVLSPVVMYHI